MWWRRDYFPPEEHPKLGDAGTRRAPVRRCTVAPRARRTLGWLELLRFRQTWGLVTAKFLSDAAWYFYLFWLPKYLYDARGFDIKTRRGPSRGSPPRRRASGVSSADGSRATCCSGRLPLNRARKLALGASAFVMPMILFVPSVPVAWAIALFSLAYFGQQSWSTLVMILPTDIFPKSTVGAVAGLVGFGGAMGGVVFGQIVGYLLDHGYGYGVVFALAGSLHVVAFATICLAIPRIEALTGARA